MTEREPGSLAHSADGQGAEWHGLARTLTHETAETFHACLTESFRAQSEAISRTTETEVLRAWFDPLARGARLRAALDGLPQVGAVPPGLHSPFVIEVGEGRLLVTHEGRELTRLLKEGLTARPGNPIRLRWADTEGADQRSLAWYRQLALSRLDSVVSLRTGAAPPLLPQAIGLVLLLAINGNFGSTRGLQRPATERDLKAVDEAVASIVGAFADVLVPPTRRRAPGAYSLYSGYAISEARRRLGSDLHHDPVALEEGSRDRVIHRLADELARRGTSGETVDKALSELVSRYELWRPRLAAYGLAQGRPGEAAAVRAALTRALAGTTGPTDA